MKSHSEHRFPAVQFSSAQDGVYALGKVHMRSTLSHRSFPKVAFETVPMFVWPTMALSRPFKEDNLALPLSTPLSSRCDGVVSLALCPEQVISQAPQHFRSSKKLAVWCLPSKEGCRKPVPGVCNDWNRLTKKLVYVSLVWVTEWEQKRVASRAMVEIATNIPHQRHTCKLGKCTRRMWTSLRIQWRSSDLKTCLNALVSRVTLTLTTS